MEGLEMEDGGGRSGFAPENLGLTPNSPLQVRKKRELGTPQNHLIKFSLIIYRIA